MEKATPILNRFTTSTPIWWAKGFVLFISLVFLGGCVDDSASIGIRKAPRFKVIYKEFDLPASTVQALPDSIRTENQFFDNSSSDRDRLLLGKATDPNFGNVTATVLTQFSPAGGLKITGKTQVLLEKLTLKLTLDYYVYGDTNSSNTTFGVHEITANNFQSSIDYFATSSLLFDANPLVTGSYFYNRDSILKSRKYLFDTNTTNNRTDTLYVDLPIGPGSLGQLLLDTALGKGIFSKSGTSTFFNAFKTDSVFKLTFKGLAIVPLTSDKILGIKTQPTSTNITLYYSYNDAGTTKHGKYLYAFAFRPAFTKIDFDRVGSPMANLVTPQTEFNAPDDYSYLQSGTGLFTKLDLTNVHAYFDTIPTLAINSAELVVPLEPIIAKPHKNEPVALLARLMSPENRFLKPSSNAFLTARTNYYAGYRFSRNYDYFLDAVGDNGSIGLNYVTSTDSRFYHGFISNFLEQNLHLPSSIPKIKAIGLLPGDAPLGKSLHGVSFKKDKIKLRVYYTRTL